jgi:trimeric autotransporter adhesin
MNGSSSITKEFNLSSLNPHEIGQQIPLSNRAASEKIQGLSSSLSMTNSQLIPNTMKTELPQAGDDEDLSLALAELGLGLLASLTIGKIKYKKLTK